MWLVKTGRGPDGIFDSEQNEWERDKPAVLTNKLVDFAGSKRSKKMQTTGNSMPRNSYALTNRFVFNFPFSYKIHSVAVAEGNSFRVC